MGKTIYLKLETEYGIITIPFLGIKEVDDFTVRYENTKELVTILIKVLNLEIDLYDVENVYLTYDKYNRGYDGKCLPIKYMGNNFNVDSLISFFRKYLEQDPKRIWNSDVRYVKTDGMLNFINTGQISSFEIKNVVNAYLSDERGYRRKRDVYFYFNEKYGSKLDIKIDKVLPDNGVRTEGLSVYDLEDDSYVSNVIDLCRRGVYTFDEAMDKIGQTDLYELSKLLKNGGYGIVDGVSNPNSLIFNDIKKLEKCTGMSIEELKLNHTNFGRRKGFRR